VCSLWIKNFDFQSLKSRLKRHYLFIYLLWNISHRQVHPYRKRGSIRCWMVQETCDSSSAVSKSNSSLGVTLKRLWIYSWTTVTESWAGQFIKSASFLAVIKVSGGSTNPSEKRNFETPYRPYISRSVCPLLSRCSVQTFLKRCSILLLLHKWLSVFWVFLCVFVFLCFFLCLCRCFFCVLSVFFRCLCRCFFCVFFCICFCCVCCFMWCLIGVLLEWWPKEEMRNGDCRGYWRARN
jgi:hypothetical protein